MNKSKRRAFNAIIKKRLGISLGRFYLYDGPPLDHFRQPERGSCVQRDLKFTIVTPSYNQGLFIKETVSSVLSQTYPFFDYIIQDSCSTDETRTNLADFQDARLKIFYEKDKGQSDAIARGFKRSGNELMCYLNSDDLLLPQALQFVADFFERHPDIDALYADRIIVDENSRIVGDWRLPPHDRSVIRVVDYIPQETLFWRRSLWDKVGGIDTTLKFAMDWDLVLRFEAAGARIAHIPMFLGAFRVHKEQKTQAEFVTGKDEMALVRCRYTNSINRFFCQIAHFFYIQKHICINRTPVKWKS